MAIGLSSIRQAIPGLAERCGELLSIGLNATPSSLLSNHRANVALRERGVRMVSLFDYDSAHPDARQALAALSGADYRFCRATYQLKILDRRTVLLEGPPLGGERSLIAVTAAPVVAAAWRYWQTAHPTAVSAAALRGAVVRDADLTARQQEIAGLMVADLGDEAIAHLVGVSVRTVRSEIAAILRALGVRTRFSAGVRLGGCGAVGPLPLALPEGTPSMPSRAPEPGPAHAAG